MSSPIPPFEVPGEISLMESIVYDSVVLKDDQTVYTFFDTADDVQGEKHTAVIETKMVEWILNHPYDPGCSLLTKELKIPQEYQFFTEVKEPVIKDNDAPGDIDILAVNPFHPELSIAIQVKRIKAFINEGNKAELKLSHITRGVDQTRHMFKKYRFHKNYLLLILVADTLNRPLTSQIFKNLFLDEKQAIYEHASFSTLQEEVGIAIYEISQPSKNDIAYTGFLGCKCLKPARSVDQMSETTEAIVELLRKKGISHGN